MWQKAEYSVKPSELDWDSSNHYIYFRRNIEEQLRDDGSTIWVCEEQLVLKEDWIVFAKLLSHEEQLTEIQNTLNTLTALLANK